MARYTGKDLYIEWIYAGGTQLMHADFRSLTTSETEDSADKTAGADTYKGYIPTFADATGEVELLDVTGSSGTTLWGAVVPGTEGTLRWSPEGTASGKAKESAAAFISARDRDMPYDDVISLTVGFQMTAAPTLDAWA